MRYVLASLIAVAIAAAVVALLPAERVAHIAGTPKVSAPARGHHTAAARSNGAVIGAAYTLQLSQAVTLSDAPGPKFRVDGSWTIEDLAGSRRAVTLRDAVLKTADKTTALPTAVRAEFKGDDLAQLGYDTKDQLAQRIIGTVASFAHLGRPQGTSWRRAEVSRTAKFAATFTRKGDRVTRIRALEGVYTGGQLAPSPEGSTVTGQTRFDLAADGLPETITGEQVLVIGRGAGRPEVRIETRFTLTRTEALRGSVGDATLDLARQHTWKATADTQRERDEAMSRGVTLEAILGDTGALGLDGFMQNRAHVSRRLSQLSALLRLHPELAPQVAAAARTAESGLPQSFYTSALAASASAEGSAALRGLLSEEDLNLRSHAAIGLGMSTYADADGAEALAALIESGELPGVAEPAAGNLARSLSETDPERAAKVVDPLIEGFEETEDRAEKLRLLNALGNSGDPRVLPIASEAIAGSDIELAMRGAYALRFVPGAEADAMLMGLLAPTINPMVQQSGLKAVEYREPGVWLQTLNAALEAEHLLAETKVQIQVLISRWT